MDIKYKICYGKCPVFSWTMFYVLLSHGNAVLPNWTLKGSLCSNCTTPLWVGFITPRCYICQFDQNIVWYIMQLSFCYKLRSQGWWTLQCWYWRWGNSCRASQLVVNRSSTTTSPVLFGTFFIISEIFGLSTEILWISAMPQGRTHICFDILHLFEAREEVRPFAPQYQPNILNFERGGSILYFWTDLAKKRFFESFVIHCICRWMSA